MLRFATQRLAFPPQSCAPCGFKPQLHKYFPAVKVVQSLHLDSRENLCCAAIIGGVGKLCGRIAPLPSPRGGERFSGAVVGFLRCVPGLSFRVLSCPLCRVCCVSPAARVSVVLSGCQRLPPLRQDSPLNKRQGTQFRKHQSPKYNPLNP